MVFIQVIFGSESTSVNEKQFRRNFEFNNETSRQVHKTFVNIFCAICRESACDEVQVFVSEWCPACYMR